jgi:hypothetical protein
MFKVEIQREDGKTWFLGDKKALEWRFPEQADACAEGLWLLHCVSGEYSTFRVIEQDGTIYSEWEV